MIQGHGGNIYDLARDLNCHVSQITDMSSNVNPLGPPDGLIAHLKGNLDLITSLPEVDCDFIIRAFADYHHVHRSSILADNGTTRLIYTLPQALKFKSASIIGPTYSDYADACSMHDVPCRLILCKEEKSFKPDMEQIHRAAEQTEAMFICNPNNPTGFLFTGAQIKRLSKAHPDTLFVIDESYLPFAENGNEAEMIGSSLPNVLVLNSMSKIFRIPGLRIGFVFSSEKIIRKIARYMLPWNVNSLAQLAVGYLMQRPDDIEIFLRRSRSFLDSQKSSIFQGLGNIPGLNLYPSATSFMLMQLPGTHRADAVQQILAKQRILIRNCANFSGLSNRFIRVSLKTHNENTRFIQKLIEALDVQ